MPPKVKSDENRRWEFEVSVDRLFQENEQRRKWHLQKDQVSDVDSISASPCEFLGVFLPYFPPYFNYQMFPVISIMLIRFANSNRIINYFFGV